MSELVEGPYQSHTCEVKCGLAACVLEDVKAACTGLPFLSHFSYPVKSVKWEAVGENQNSDQWGVTVSWCADNTCCRINRCNIAPTVSQLSTGGELGPVVAGHRFPYPDPGCSSWQQVLFSSARPPSRLVREPVSLTNLL